MIEEVIDGINQNILFRAEELCKQGNPMLNGLAEPILIKSEYENEDKSGYPAIIDNEGECKYVFADDNYSFGIYHRLVNRAYTVIKGYGDTNRDARIDEIILVCWGFRNQLEMNSVSFENQIIVPSLPKEAILVQSNFDQFSVYNNEFKNIIYNLIPELFLFSVKYKVQYIFDRECMEISEENKCQ